MSRRSVLLLVLAVSLMSALPGTAVAKGPTEGPVPLTKLHFKPLQQQIGDLFGLGAYIARRYPALAGPSLYRIGLTGTDWVRDEFTASRLHHSTNGHYHWATYDKVVNATLRRHIHILGLLDYNNTFNGLSHTAMPHQDIHHLTVNFVAYVEAIVKHYKGRIEDWQIWNEPDLHIFWAPYRYAADYAYLLSQSYQAIKLIDPKAQVLIGGPSGSDPHAIQFLHRVVAAGGKFDIMTAQPYSNEPNWALMERFRTLESFHRPVWITEMGWAGQADCPECGSPWTQASRLSVVYYLAAIGGIKRMFWYDFRDDGVGETWRDHFGLVEWNLSAKPAYLAYELSHYVFNDKTIVGRDPISSGLSIWELKSGRKVSFVVWNDTQEPLIHLALAWPYGSYRVLNYLGQTIGKSSFGTLNLWVQMRRLNYIIPSQAHFPTFAPKGLNIPPGHTP